MTEALLTRPESVPVPPEHRAALLDLLGGPASTESVGPEQRIEALERFAGWLAGPGVERGLLGPREAPRLWERHLLNCAGLVELLEPGQVVLDLGSGAGLPGVVLALLRPDLSVVLLEPLQRRAEFLQEVVTDLGLRSAVVRRARAEDLAGSVEVDVVTARAVAPIDRLAGWALPLLRPGGRLLALKGERAQDELTAAAPALEAAGAASHELRTVGSGPSRSTVVVVQAGTSVRAPVRRASVGRKREQRASRGRPESTGSTRGRATGGTGR